MPPRVTLRLGNCIDVLRTIDAESIDACVTDPPYELGFMGKKWDAAGVAFDPATWQEVLRVLKPGGHLLAFGGTRTYHRMTCAIEDAGFEIRDSLHWLYGSGFPKSLNISKAIDKAAGEAVVVGKAFNMKGKNDDRALEAARWEGWGTALKPAHEPIVLARKPIDGTVAANVLEYGTGGINIEACRVASGDALVRPPIQRRDNAVFGLGLGLGRQDEPAGRWPPNLLLTHDLECGDECTPGCPVAELDRQSGVLVAGTAVRRHVGHSTSHGASFGVSGSRDLAMREDVTYGDSGGASRFFPCFRYVAKPSKRERGEGNIHPTVKPIALMRWLCKLVTPPGGVVLDPFMGSGTTGVAAVQELFRFLGIEREEEYFKIAADRIKAHLPPRPESE